MKVTLPVEQRDRAWSYQPVSPRPCTVRWLRNENFHHISFDKCLRRVGRATLTQELTYTFHLIYIAAKLLNCTKCFLSSKMDCTMKKKKLASLAVLWIGKSWLSENSYVWTYGAFAFHCCNTKSIFICCSSLAHYRVRSSFHLTEMNFTVHFQTSLTWMGTYIVMPHLTDLEPREPLAFILFPHTSIFQSTKPARTWVKKASQKFGGCLLPILGSWTQYVVTASEKSDSGETRLTLFKLASPRLGDNRIMF